MLCYTISTILSLSSETMTKLLSLRFHIIITVMINTSIIHDKRTETNVRYMIEVETVHTSNLYRRNITWL